VVTIASATERISSAGGSVEVTSEGVVEEIFGVDDGGS
jgi:hypothetical protein